jgi:hypothetical protein
MPENRNIQIEKFNDSLNIWISELKLFTLDQLLKKPDEKSWSLGQVYMHIIEEANWYNEQSELSLADTENSDIPLPENAKKLFEAGSFADIKIQADTAVSDNVKEPESINQISENLEKVKKSTNDLWVKISNNKSFGRSEFPGFGYLNCFEWLQFSEMHMSHHLRQKRRIEEFLKNQ